MTDPKDDPPPPPFVWLRGTDIGGPVYAEMPCIVCGAKVEPGTGAQAVPPLPALHTTCMRELTSR